MLREASIEAASMSPSKSSSCRRTTKVQFTSEWGRKGEGRRRKRRRENIRPSAAAPWNVKPGSFALFNKEENRKKKNFLNMSFKVLVKSFSKSEMVREWSQLWKSKY